MKFWQWEHITRDDKTPYLTRLHLLSCSWFSLLVHWFHSSDDACLHDHPWRYVALILKGGYWEVTERVVDNQIIRDKLWYPVGSVLFRCAEHAHRIEIDPANPPTTLVLHGWKTKHWGFFTPKGWVGWREYNPLARQCA
jgi:hypothetical protein